MKLLCKNSFFPTLFITFVIPFSTQLICLIDTGFTCLCHNGYLYLFLLVYQLVCGDLFDRRSNRIDNVDMKHKTGWRVLVSQILRKKYQCQYREPIDQLNACFISNVQNWYSKDLQMTSIRRKPVVQ